MIPFASCSRHHRSTYFRLTAVILMTTSLLTTAPAVSADDKSQQKKKKAMPKSGQQVEREFEASDSGIVEYLLYLPEDYPLQDLFRLVLFLHGRGESYGPLSLVTKWGPPRFAARGDDLPYILVAPQCPGEDSWSSDTQQQRVKELLDQMVEEFKVDSSRLYLTGLSMGGYGSWTMAARHPDRFAAVVPICGGVDAQAATKLTSLPIWVWHGTDDGAVPFECSVEMVDAIKQAGGKKIRFTSLEHVGHNSWSAAYATADLSSCMLAQQRGDRKENN